MGKTKIFTNLKRSFLPFGMIILGNVFSLCMPTIDRWDMSWLECLLFYGFLGLILIILLILFFMNYETAELSEEGIRFYTAIYPGEQKVKWEEIVEIIVKPKITFESSTGYKTKYSWIHICLEPNIKLQDEFGEAKATKKEAKLFYIIYKPEKARILANYCKRYCPDLDITCLEKKHNTRPKTKWGY